MTDKEAIKRLKEVQAEFNENWVDYGGINEAFKKAYQALKKPQGEWKTDGAGNITCSNCRFSLGSKIVKLLHPFSFPYCPECGAKMRGEEECNS